AELPCNPSDSVWKATEPELSKIVTGSLAHAGIPIRIPVDRVAARRLEHAYPVYLRGYRDAFAKIDEWAERMDRLTNLGRQGLFAHDNTHHTLAMAYAAVDCLSDEGRFDRMRWSERRREFEAHVVED
ncbi:MAG: hypothetical protein ACREX0_19945, partial [Noviherbaspirillum sp.]